MIMIGIRISIGSLLLLWPSIVLLVLAVPSLAFVLPDSSRTRAACNDTTKQGNVLKLGPGHSNSSSKCVHFYKSKEATASPTRMTGLTRMYSFNENNNNIDTSESIESTSWTNKIITTITNDPKQSLLFSISSTAAGAILGPFLDTYHSLFGVLQYDYPFTMQLWSYNQNIPALVTTWWVPYLFGLAGFLIGWLYILLDALTGIDQKAQRTTPMGYSPPIISIGIAIFTFQYWSSGILSSYNIDRSIIFVVMSVYAYYGFVKLDNTKSGFMTSLATAIGGPLIEVGLISYLTDSIGGYHYIDSGETGFFPLWIVPVYFLGGPANGNLARGIWEALGSSTNTSSTSTSSANKSQNNNTTGPNGCPVCNDTRLVPCPNCDGMGYYVTYGREVKCNCCKGRGYVICRECFHLYDEDPSDIEAIREMMSRLPD